VLVAIAGSSVATVGILAGGGDASSIVLAAIPGAAAVWLAHPLMTLFVLRNRRRKRTDDSINFWRVGLVCGPLAFACATMTWLSDHPRWPMLLGFTVVWGWAGSIVHGMLSRIVPFLVWFHRYSWLVGKTRVPPMRRLWPKRHLRATLVLHLATLLLGLAAIATGSKPLAAATGTGLVVTGCAVFSGLARVALHMRGKHSAHATAQAE
jgi:hypothetical protein